MRFEDLDEIDNRILDILSREARLSFSEIGERVGLSRVAVKNRMSAMENKGIISGYSAVINWEKLPGGKLFFVEVCTEPDRFDEVVDYFARQAIIRKVYAITGESRFRAEGFASDNEEYRQFLIDVRSNLKGAKDCSIQNLQYIIKDTDGGVDYVSFNQ